MADSYAGSTLDNLKSTSPTADESIGNVYKAIQQIKRVMLNEEDSRGLLGYIDERIEAAFSAFKASFPVGYIYISLGLIDPSTIFGGLWERLPDGSYLVNDENLLPDQTEPSYIDQWFSNGKRFGMPDYSQAISLGNITSYRATQDGWIQIDTHLLPTGQVFINGISVMKPNTTVSAVERQSILLPMYTNDSLTTSGVQAVHLNAQFFPCVEGSDYIATSMNNKVCQVRRLSVHMWRRIA